MGVQNCVSSSPSFTRFLDHSMRVAGQPAGRQDFIVKPKEDSMRLREAGDRSLMFDSEVSYWCPYYKWLRSSGELCASVGPGGALLIGRFPAFPS